MPMARSWNGLTLRDRMHRAAGRATVAIATHIAIETKRVTHVQYGTLRRSVHAAPVEYDGSEDESRATGGDLLADLPEPSLTPLGPSVQVGSWLPYACAEWIGRGHPGINEGVEAVRGALADRLVQVAFQEEGL